MKIARDITNPEFGATADTRAHRASTHSGAAQAPEVGRADTNAPPMDPTGVARKAPRGASGAGDNWCVCGLYTVAYVAAQGRIEISLAGEVIDYFDSAAAGDFYAHVISLKSQGARSIFLDGVMMARRLPPRSFHSGVSEEEETTG